MDASRIARRDAISRSTMELHLVALLVVPTVAFVVALAVGRFVVGGSVVTGSLGAHSPLLHCGYAPSHPEHASPDIYGSCPICVESEKSQMTRNPLPPQMA